MELRLIASQCDDGDCPAIYATDRGSFIVQGLSVTDPQALAALHLPSGEAAVEIPRSLILRAAREP
jgi:hypothetical protein